LETEHYYTVRTKDGVVRSIVADTLTYDAEGWVDLTLADKSVAMFWRPLSVVSSEAKYVN